MIRSNVTTLVRLTFTRVYTLHLFSLPLIVLGCCCDNPYVFHVNHIASAPCAQHFPQPLLSFETIFLGYKSNWIRFDWAIVNYCARSCIIHKSVHCIRIPPFAHSCYFQLVLAFLTFSPSTSTSIFGSSFMVYHLKTY